MPGALDIWFSSGGSESAGGGAGSPSKQSRGETLSFSLVRLWELPPLTPEAPWKKTPQARETDGIARLGLFSQS